MRALLIGALIHPCLYISLTFTLAARIDLSKTYEEAKILKYQRHSHLQHPPGKPVLPTAENAAKASAVRNTTAQAAVKADEIAEKIGDKIHEGGKKLGESLPDELAKPSPAVEQGQKGEARKLAEEGWHQATIAAKGLADAAATVGSSISGNAHKAIEHNYGTEADRVAQGESCSYGDWFLRFYLSRLAWSAPIVKTVASSRRKTCDGRLTV